MAACSLAFAAALLLAGCERKGPGGPMMERPPAPVSVAPALRQDVPTYLDEIGRMVSVEVVSIVPQVGGKVMATHVQDGDFVQQGQVLFEIDPRPYEAALAAAEATRAQSKADLELAHIDFKRMEEMLTGGTGSQIEFDHARVGLEVAEAKLAAAVAAVQTARLNLEYTKIVSPLAGRAGARLIDAGNVVRENDAPMVIIRRLDPIYVEFTVTENDLAGVRQALAATAARDAGATQLGLRVLVDPALGSAAAGTGSATDILASQPASASAPAAPTMAAMPFAGAREGQLTFIDNSVQGTTGTIRVRATVANPDRVLWPGQNVNVRLILATKKDAVLVPAEARQISQQGSYVYVINAENKAELRPIVTGQRQGSLLVVESGLTAGERVVIAGHMMVIPGRPVRVTNENPQASPGASPPGGEAAS